MTRILGRRTILAGVAVTAAVLLSGCGGGTDQSGSMPGMGGTTTAAPTGSTAASFNDADVQFAQQMIPHHQQAVQMAVMAETGATDPEVKALAGKIKAAQDPEITTMTGWLTTWGKPAPTTSMGSMDMSGAAMPGMMSDADMGKLGAMKGKNVDTQFLTMMIAHHQGAVTMAQQELTTGTNAQAKALAEQIITSQTAEISTMKSILARL